MGVPFPKGGVKNNFVVPYLTPTPAPLTVIEKDNLLAWWLHAQRA